MGHPGITTVLLPIIMNAASASAEDPKCGGTIESPTGVLRAPDSDNDGWYDANANCLWVISAKKGTRIRYRAIVDAEESENFARCRIDFLKIFECFIYGNSVYGYSVHRRLCGASKLSRTTETNVLYIRWRTVESYKGMGFNLTFYHVDNGTEIATTPSSSTSLTSRKYPLFTTMTPLGKFSTFPLKIKTRWPLNDVEAESSEDMEAEFLKFTTQKSVNIPQPFPEPWPVQPRTWEPKLPDHDEVSGTQMTNMALVQLFVLIIVVYFAIC